MGLLNAICCDEEETTKRNWEPWEGGTDISFHKSKTESSAYVFLINMVAVAVSNISLLHNG